MEGDMQMTIFGDVTPCSLVEIYRRFEETYCFNFQVEDWDKEATSKKETAREAIWRQE
jgi:hypothetical protein